MNSFSALLTPDDVLLDLEASSAKTLFQRIAETWAGRHGIEPAAAVEQLLARERLGSTGLGEGVAIPHARIARLATPAVAVVRPREPLGFGAPDNKPVACFFVLMVPEEATERHLQILADAVRLLAEPGLRDRLKACGTPLEVCALLQLDRP